MTKLEQIAARLAAATPGPWSWGHIANDQGGLDPALVAGGGVFFEANGLRNPNVLADAELIANAPTDLAFLLRLVQMVAEEQCDNELTYPCRNTTDKGSWCWPCRIRKELSE